MYKAFAYGGYCVQASIRREYAVASFNVFDCTFTIFCNYTSARNEAEKTIVIATIYRL